MEESFNIVPVPTIPFNEILWFNPLKLLFAIPTLPNTPVTESKPAPTIFAFEVFPTFVGPLGSRTLIVMSYLSGSSSHGSISLVTSLNA